MAKYTFNYWFERGCSEDHCPCLWSADDVTRNEYHYGVNLSELPISQGLVQFLCQLGMKHDAALDWEYPLNPLLWTREEEEQFYVQAKEGYQRLKEELGEDYEIIYCEEK